MTRSSPRTPPSNRQSSNATPSSTVPFFPSNTPPSKRRALNILTSSAESTTLSSPHPAASAVRSRLSSLKRQSVNSPSRASAASVSSRVASSHRSPDPTTPTRNPMSSAPAILIAEGDDDDPDDNVPLSIRRRFLQVMGPSSIKSELAEPALHRSVIDVDAYPDLDDRSPKTAVASHYNVDDTSPSKRFKLESGTSPRTPVNENAELRRLMEQSERDEELLRQEQRVAGRMRILHETKARIAEMQAKKKGKMVQSNAMIYVGYGHGF
jgi:hypothetical protein